VAYDAFRKAQQEKRTLIFLLSHLGYIRETIAIIQHNFEAIREIDRVREIIARRIPIIIDFDLWRHVRGDQQLKTECEHRITSKDRYGEERQITVRESNIYGPVSGHIMLEPKAKPIYDRLKICHTRLRMIDFGERFAEHLGTLSSEDKAKVAKLLEKEIRKAQELLAEAVEVKRFLSLDNLATLRGWGKHEDCPTKLYIAFVPDGRQLRIGRTDQQFQVMKVQPPFWNTLRQISILTAQRSAAE
jgi:hypothetical protein